jgi:FAD:protein FMN transferase
MTATVAPALVEHRFRAMGTEVQITLVDGDAGLLAIGERRIRELESRWSRFVPTSEVSAMNRHAGHPVIVSAETFQLVDRAIRAWTRTEGRFDPTVGAALVAHGYDRDFAEIDGAAAPAPAASVPAPGASGIELTAGLSAVILPPGVHFDAGGIGKGLAADLTASWLVARGAGGALVNLGGDLHAFGRPPTPEGWIVTVADPFEAGQELLRVALPEGAVATSSRLVRRWRTTAGEAHHLIDPSTGRPADTDAVAVTVVAAEAWWAEALTKSLFLAGPPALGDLPGAHAVIVTADGTRHATTGLRSALR